MKSTIKSAFAIIAVALMIMVAVVPMVGVFTEDSSATSQTKVDPSTDTNNITVNVYVRDSSDNAKSGVTVKIAYGSYSFTAVTADTTGLAKFNVKEASVAKLTATVVDSDGNEIKDYPAVTLEKLVTGQEYTATLKEGVISKTVTFVYADGTTVLSGQLTTGDVVTANYVAYDGNDANAKQISSGKFVVNSDFTATFQVPIGTIKAYVTVNDFTSPIGVTFTKSVKQEVTISATDSKLKADEQLITISENSSLTGKVTVTKLVGTYDTDKTITFKAITGKDAISKTAKAYFIGDVSAISSPTSGITYKADLSADNSKAADVTLSESSYTLTYTIAGAFFGNIKTSANDITQAGTLSAKLTFSDDATTTVTMQNVTVDADGNFFKFVESTATGTVRMSDESFTLSDSRKFVPTTSSTYTGSAALAFTMPTADSNGVGYSLVSGYLKCGSTQIVGKTLVVTGAKTYGSLVTTAGGAFKFMAETGKNITVSAAGADLYGDVSIVPGNGSTDKQIFMPTQTVTLKVADALGNVLESATVKLKDGTTDIGTLTWTAASKNYEGTIRADLKATDYEVSITFTNYTFTRTATAFTEGSTYYADNAEYELKFYKADGTANSISSEYSLYIADAYKNTLGSIVYTYDDSSSISVSNSKFKVDSKYVGYTVADIGATPVKVLLLVNINLASNGIYKPYYVLDADDKGVISITASADSLTGKLTRNDGVTGIAGIKAQLYKSSTINDSNLVDTTYTQADGTFTVYSDLAIGSEYVMKFSTEASSGYTFNETDSAYSSAKKVTAYKAKTDAYTVSLVDADGEKIILANGATFTIGSVTFTAVNGTNTATGTAGWTATTGKDLAVAFEAADAKDTTARSFVKFTPTAAQLASGNITLTSNQSTYTFNVTDFAGVGLNGASIQFYKYIGDYAEKITSATATADAYGVAKFLLPIATEKDLDTVYGYTVSLANYTFASSAKVIDDVDIDVKSTTVLKYIYLQDAAGVALGGIPETVTIYADGETGPTVVTKAAGYFTFYADDSIEYTYDIAMSAGSKYSFVEGITDVDGVVNAKQETVTGTVTDAAGNYFGIKVEEIYAYDVKNNKLNVTAGEQLAGDKSFSIVADKSEIAYYVAGTVTSGDIEFTFEPSATADIKAVETFVPMVFTSANGLVDTINSLYYTVSTVDALGNQTSKTVVTVNGVYGVIADVDDVDHYAVTVTSAGNYFATGTYTTKDGTLVSTVAYYTGSVGVSGVSGKALVEIYNGSALINRDDATVTNGVYSITADLSLGDKVIVTYTTEDATYTAVMDNKAVYNDLKLVVTADDLKAKIIGGKEYDDSEGSGYFTYTISADKTKVYLMAINSYTLPVSDVAGDANVDSLVAKYVFAGWYVNGEKATKDLTYTVDNVDSNVVMALYEFDGYYEVDEPVSADNGISPTVLVIGIAAVIIALIAVVYAVIQKEE